LIDKGRWKRATVSTNAGKEGDKFATAILLKVLYSAFFVLLFTHHPLAFIRSTGQKALLIPIVDIGRFEVVLRNCLVKLTFSSAEAQNNA
jgi:hypothetical protein